MWNSLLSVEVSSALTVVGYLYDPPDLSHLLGVTLVLFTFLHFVCLHSKALVQHLLKQGFFAIETKYHWLEEEMTLNL